MFHLITQIPLKHANMMNRLGLCPQGMKEVRKAGLTCLGVHFRDILRMPKGSQQLYVHVTLGLIEKFVSGELKILNVKTHGTLSSNRIRSDQPSSLNSLEGRQGALTCPGGMSNETNRAGVDIPREAWSSSGGTGPLEGEESEGASHEYGCSSSFEVDVPYRILNCNPSSSSRCH